jgi:hypothetical protein
MSHWIGWRSATLLLALAGCAHEPTVGAASTPAPRPGTHREFAVVSTIHKGHLMQPQYPLGFLCRILADYAPDLVLVEIRPDAFTQGHHEDGPFEMAYVVDCARAHRVPVEPIDWWQEQDMEASGPTLTAEEQTAFTAEVAALEQPVWPSFVEANAAAARQRGMRLLNAQARYFAGNPVWTRRQAWFDHQALQAIDRRRARRVLAFVGFNHAPELEAHLRSFELDARDPLGIAKSQPVESNDRAPDSVIQMWRSGLARLQVRAQSASGVTAQRLNAKARYFEVAIERAGTCCVSSSALEVR